MTYSRRIVEAVEMAHELHGSQVRKCGDVPYITHLMAVSAIVGTSSGNIGKWVGLR